MKKMVDYFLVGIFMMTALLVAAVGLRAYSGYVGEDSRDGEITLEELDEIMSRNAMAQERVLEMENEITSMLDDVDTLQQMIDDVVASADMVQMQKAQEAQPQDAVAVFSDSVSVKGTISGGSAYWEDDAVPGGTDYDAGKTISGNGLGSGTISGNGFGNGTTSGNSIWGDGTISGNRIFLDGNTVSGNADPFGLFMPGVSANGIAGGDGTSVSGNSIYDDWLLNYGKPELRLEERRELRTSYQETFETNQADKERIAGNTYDFSEVKIACLGDSITAGANLPEEEDPEQYAYPAVLKELLGAAQVYNLGIGGSSIGRYWSDAFVDRYSEIPEDVDIIIVMGGTNDGFCVSEREFGTLSERKNRTFCGDLYELMSGLREHYPDADIFFATPLPNVLQDYLMSERDYLLPQKNFVDVIRVMSKAYRFPVIDLYNSNMLDSHDANVIVEYMPDGVHCNAAGYEILAEHFASELIQYYDENGGIDGGISDSTNGGL